MRTCMRAYVCVSNRLGASPQTPGQQPAAKSPSQKLDLLKSCYFSEKRACLKGQQSAAESLSKGFGLAEKLQLLLVECLSRKDILQEGGLF